MNNREKLSLALGGMFLFLLIIALAGVLISPDKYAVNYLAKNLPPSTQHLFGTDHLGRDMFYRTLCGLSTSIVIGLLAAFFSSLVALVLGVLSAVFGGKIDRIITWLVDLCMGIPHMVLLILISVILGGGIKGVVIGVVATHWPSLTRVIRAEVMQIRSAHYVLLASKLGSSNWKIAKQHIFPHVFPQYIIGLVLLFPHAILHEAGITFLGYGLSLDTPAIGIILSESMRYLAMGMWWLAIFPGLALLGIVLTFEYISERLKLLIDPNCAQE